MNRLVKKKNEQTSKKTKKRMHAFVSRATDLCMTANCFQHFTSTFSRGGRLQFQFPQQKLTFRDLQQKKAKKKRFSFETFSCHNFEAWKNTKMHSAKKVKKMLPAVQNCHLLNLDEVNKIIWKLCKIIFPLISYSLEGQKILFGGKLRCNLISQLRSLCCHNFYYLAFWIARQKANTNP